MKKIVLGLAAVAAGVASFAVAGSAQAAVVDTDAPTSTATSFALVAWQMPDGWETNGWFPQTFAAEAFLTTGDASNLHALDDTLAALPGCHSYQVDIYPNGADTAAYIAGLVASGTLHQGDDYGLTGAWDIRQHVGTGCNPPPPPPPCTEYIVTTFEMPGFDPVVGKTFPQTLTSTSEPTCNPTFPQPPDCKNTQMDIFRADGPLTKAYLEDGILTEAEGNDPALWAEMYEGGSGNSWRLYPATNCPLDAGANIVVNPPTCDSLSTIVGISGANATLNGGLEGLDRTVGTHTATFTAVAGHLFANGTTTLTVNYTIRAKDTVSDECIPDIGGRTIGFWGNKNGTAAGAGIWNAAKAPYANAIPAATTFTQAQALLKVDGSTNNGKDMLRAQFIATALNVQFISGYGDQKITVPASSAVDGGQVVTVKKYLADVNAAWASLTTKAQITSVKDVLDAINQDVASVLFV